MIALMGKRKKWGKSILGQTNSKCEVSELKMISLSLETNMCRKDRVGDEIKRHKLATYLCRICTEERKDEDENRGGKRQKGKRE